MQYDEKTMEKLFDKHFSKIMEKKLKDYDLKLIEKNKQLFNLYKPECTLHNLSVDFITCRYEGLSSETVAKKHVQKSGFMCVKLSDSVACHKELPEYLQKIRSELAKYEELSGCPDFICFNVRDYSDFFLMEVKSNNDTLKKNQFLWFYKYPQFKIKLLFLNEVKEVDWTKI